MLFGEELHFISLLFHPFIFCYAMFFTLCVSLERKQIFCEMYLHLSNLIFLTEPRSRGKSTCCYTETDEQK